MIKDESGNDEFNRKQLQQYKNDKQKDNKRVHVDLTSEDEGKEEVKVKKEDDPAIIRINAKDNPDDFWWCKNGEDNVRADKKGGKLQPGKVTYKKEYFICSTKKSRGLCEAKKRIHHLPDGIKYEYSGFHNHEPPAKPLTSAEVTKKIEDYLHVGAKAAVIQSRLMKEAREARQPITPKNVPTKQKFYNT